MPAGRKRKLWFLALSSLATYVAIILVLMLLEDRLLYCTGNHQGNWRAPPHDLQVQELWLRAADGCPIHAWWSPCPNAKGAVLYCHGNGRNLSHSGDTLVAMVRALGRGVLVFDYPGFGRSGGQSTEAGCYAAADAAYDWLVRQVPPQQIVILGQSLGGGIATDLASRRPHGALVLFKTFTSVPDLAQSKLPFLPARWLVHNHFENLAKIAQCRGPVFISHGDQDDLIPLSQARRLYRAAPEPKRLYLLKGWGHHGSFTQELLEEINRFLEETAVVEAGPVHSLAPWSLGECSRLHASASTPLSSISVSSATE
jgi:pimeloyl-ACP methyl ester carboxylesterase